jgi:hypothetical protein
MPAIRLRSLPDSLKAALTPPKPRLRRRSPEGKLHRNVALNLGQIFLPGTFWTTHPLGGGGRRRGGIIKGMGVKPGIPDLMIAHAGKTLWVELKAPKNGVLSDVQDRCHAELRLAGHFVEIGRSMDDVIAALDKHGIPHAIVLPTGAILKGMIAAPQTEKTT